MKPDVTIITPGGDRPWSLELLKNYLLRQSFPGTIQWLVVHDSQNPGPYIEIWLDFMEVEDARFRECEMYQLPFDPSILGPKSLSQNLWWGLRKAQGEIIMICEDDDWYGPEHIKECVNHLAKPGIKATGTIWQRYYHLPSLSHRTYKNVGSALCSTAFHSSIKGRMVDAAKWCGEHNRKGLDRRFWDSLKPEWKDIFEPEKNQVIGMKGLPGRFGIGIGHQPRGFEKDQEALVLRDWVGDDADLYLAIRSKHDA